MLILALDTITRAGSLGLWEAGALQAREGDPTRTHAERLPGEAINWLAEHGHSLADVDLLAVLSGPGSFTGIRVGLAATQGLALAGHRRVIGVPSLDAVATSWLLAGDAPDHRAILLVACIDAQRSEVFSAAWHVPAEHLPEATAVEACPVAWPPAVGSPRDLVTALRDVAGTSLVVLVGDGAVRYRDLFAEACPGARIGPPPMPLAGAAAALAHRRQAEAGAPHALRPIYLRRPDVEVARERRARQAATPDPLTVTLASSADIADVERLQARTFTNPWGAAAIRWELENTDVARLYVMRAPGGALLAYCACWVVFDELHINSLAVDPGWRRRGLALRLLEHVLAEARAAGVNAATLEVRSSNNAARQLYERLRFTVEGVRRDYYQHPREDALILWRRDLRR